LAGDADVNRDSYVTGSELGSYLEDQVTNYTRGAQTPIYGKIHNPDLDRGDMVFALKQEEMAVVRPPVTPPAQPPRQEHAELQIYTEMVRGVAIEMVRLPAGKFLMGSPDNEAGRYENEGPQHEVTISKPFYMGKYEATQAQWRAVASLPKVKIELKAEPSRFKECGGNCPVERVIWEEAVEFCERLSRASGKRYRLPTEAEWEYGCRGGTAGAYAGNLDEMAWYGNNSGRVRIDASELWQTKKDALDYQGKLADNGCQTHAVGKKKANGFGLYDMHGNVWEWCSDWLGGYSGEAQVDPEGPSTGTRRVVRGGSWYMDAARCRSAYRVRPSAIALNAGLLGFRLVRTYS
jgi:formylglycine-generating enzyme required for sulfatase activity